MLRINGYNVPLAAAGLGAALEVEGTRRRGVHGNLLESVNARAPVLDAGTPWLSPGHVAAIQGLVEGRGHRWPLNLEGADLDLYATTGLYPHGTPVAQPRTAEQHAWPSGNVAVPRFGDACLAIDPTTTNIYPANVRTGTDTSGDATGFAERPNDTATTIASSTEQAWQGSRSLKVVGTGELVGVRLTATSTPGVVYTASVYVRSPVSATFRLIVTTDTPIAQQVTVQPDVWTRIALSRLLPSGSGTIDLVRVDESAEPFYLDGFQLEQQARPTSWVNGSRSQATSLAYRLPDFRTRDNGLCLMGWFLAVETAADRVLFAAYDETYGAGLVVSASFSPAVITAQAFDGGGPVATAAGTWPTGFAWRHVAAVLRRQPDAGEWGLEVYVDGARVGQAEVGEPPYLGSGTILTVGQHPTSVGASRWTGLVDELVALPFAPTAGMIAAFAERTFSALPHLLASGRAFGSGDVELEARGEVIQVDSLPAATPEGYVSALDFRLRGVQG